MTLNEIRKKLQIQETTEEEEKKPQPIAYEKYKMWSILRQEPEIESEIKILSTNKKQVSDMLQCPKCDEYYMHHVSVEMFSRTEDSDTGKHSKLVESNSYGWDCINVIAPQDSVDSDMSDNPSGRRNGISITFVCECCHEVLKLGISQDKGHSKLAWRHYK